jgi:hypothetical protein
VKAGLIDKPENWRWSSAWSGWENVDYSKRALNMPVWNPKCQRMPGGIPKEINCSEAHEELVGYEWVE